MNIVVDRKWKKEGYTIGNIYINGIFFGNSLEDRDRGLDSNMPLAEIQRKKVYGQTAIPAGTYQVKMTYSNRFATKSWGRKYNGKVPELLNVKGFDGVRIHPGNTAKDTLGCILIGKNTAKGTVTQSIEYYFKLLDYYILPAIKKNEKLYINLK